MQKAIALAELPTLTVALQEYEWHFSEIWGNFPDAVYFAINTVKNALTHDG